MRRLTIRLFVLLGLFLSSSLGVAQWSTIAPNLLEIIPSTSGGFGSIDNRNGIVWVGRTALWKSQDTGTTWVKVHDSFGGTITEIKFFDANIGVVASIGGVFLTINQGQTWTLILNKSSFGASFAGSAQNIVAVCDGNGFFYSNDGGTTWKSNNPATHLLCILGRADGSALGFGGSDATTAGNLYSTTNFGATWQGSASTDYDSFSLAEDSCSGTIYRMNEEGHIKTNNAAQFYSTIDKGVNWISKTSHAGTYYSGSIAISPDAIFCSTLNNGIERSTDKGSTWINIGGPSNNIDTRLISAINDNIIIAADGNGNILRTTNCGGFPLTATPTPTFFIPSISISSCSSVGSNVLASLTACGHLILQSATLQGADISHFSLNPKSFPYDLSSHGKDTFYISFDPKHQTGSFFITLHIQGIYPSTGLPFDTLITIQAISNPVAPALSANRTLLDYKTISTCDPQKDSVFVLTNTGCDTLTIISGPGIIDPSFIIDSLILPLKIPPGGSVVIHVHCKSNGQGSVNSMATYVAEQQGITRTVEVDLQVIGTQGMGKLALGSNKLNFKPISFCSRDSLMGFFTNSGCDTLIIDTAGISGDLDFLTELGSYPFILLPGDTIRFIVHLDPKSKGSRSALITIKGHNAHGNRLDMDTTITISATVKNGSAILSTPSTFINFDSLSSCSLRDTTITLSNPGCDTLYIKPNSLSGDPDFSSTLPSQIIIPPGDSAAIVIRLSPQLPGLRNGQLHLLVGLPPSQRDTILTLTGIVSDDLQKFSLSMKSCIFDSTTICNSRDTTITLKNTGCDSLSITSAYLDGDTDFTLNSSPSTIGSGDSEKYTITLSPKQLGSRTAYLHISIGTGSRKRDTMIMISGLIVKGSTILTASISSCDFGTTTICQERDTLIHLHNSGCDTLQIFSIAGLTTGFGTKATFPITILPGHDSTVDIYTSIDTSGRQTLNQTILTFTGNSNPPLPPIPLVRNIAYPHLVTFRLLSEQTEKTSAQEARFKLKVNTATPSDIRTIDFQLHYNSDLLSYESSNGSNTVSTPNDTFFTISGNPFVSIDSDSTVAEFRFKVFLTRDSVTDLRLSDLHLNSADPKYEQCIASAQADSSSFQYQYFCGERSIAAYLNGMPEIVITSIRPNPAQDDLELTLRSAVLEDVRIEIRSALGQPVSDCIKTVNKGQIIIPFHIPSLAQGLYVLRISTPYGIASQSFIKMK